MVRDDLMGLLFDCACSYRFEEFDDLFEEIVAGYPLKDIAEAYLMRAQIKLYISDETLVDDLEKIKACAIKPRFPRLGRIWKADTPNRFIVFSLVPGRIRVFESSLPHALELMWAHLGDEATTAICQIQCELNYFFGNIHHTLALAEAQRDTSTKIAIDAIHAQMMRFRCCLAVGHTREAEESMLDVIRLSQKHPDCLTTYQAFRSWVNLTTNWGGDTPRFENDSSGKRVPVLEERLKGVREGTSQTTPLEGPFIRQAERRYAQVYTLRQHYMDLLLAMYWLKSGDVSQAQFYFRKVCRVAQEGNIVMPTIECGEHVTPLLIYAKERHWACPEWLDGIIARAKQYEQHLLSYQNFDV